MENSLARTKKELFCYCLQCKREQELIVDRIISKRKGEMIYKGQCKGCGEELCRVFVKESQ